MKTGLVTSVTMHAVLLGFGIFSLSAPRAYEVADVEALPVDIVPVDSFSQVQEGDKTAALEREPTPTPTERPDPVENAQKTGEADTDQKTPPTPEAKPKPVERTAESTPAPEPQPKPVEKPVEETQQAKAEDAPAPATEREPEPQPRQEVTPEPAEEPLVAENAQDESVRLPQSAPVPQARPQPPKPQTAKAPEREETETPAAREQARSEKKEEDDELFDQVAALLNKEEASGGGAKRSTNEAALGGERTTAGETLTQSEEDAIRRKMEQCWQVPAGAMGLEGVRISIQFRLDPSGAVEGSPEIVSSVSSSVERAVADSARRAILRCQPYNLPAEKYNAWAEMKMNFDPTDMF